MYQSVNVSKYIRIYNRTNCYQNIDDNLKKKTNPKFNRKEGTAVGILFLFAPSVV